MRLITTLALTSLCVCSLPRAQADPAAVVAEPSAVAKGQPVTFRWYFTGSKVTISGGRFGKGVVVTGKQRLTDTPKATTTYKFDVWYKGLSFNPKTQQQEMMPLHATYPVVVEVVDATMPVVSTYRDPHGWQIRMVKGWQHDSVPMPDPANNGLFFFQQEDDAVERVAVSVLPAKDLTSDDLMRQVEADMPAHYGNVTKELQEPVTIAGVAGTRALFSGMDMAHPGTRTQSIVITLVHEGRGFVLSGRTSASHFPIRQPILAKLVQSFAFVGKTTASR